MELKADRVIEKKKVIDIGKLVNRVVSKHDGFFFFALPKLFSLWTWELKM